MPPIEPGEAEYIVECLSKRPNLWYFVSRLHGLTRAIELAAVMREIKGNPSRVTRADGKGRLRVDL